MLEKHLNIVPANEAIEKKIQENNKKILEKVLIISDISEENSDIEFAIGLLEDEEKKIIELRYKKNKKFQPMSDNFNMSASTVARKVCRIVRKINENIEN